MLLNVILYTCTSHTGWYSFVEYHFRLTHFIVILWLQKHNFCSILLGSVKSNIYFHSIDTVKVIYS